MKHYNFISWGGGVQSTAMAVMSAFGDLPQVDAVIMADTGWERTKTIEVVKFYKKWLNDNGIRVHITSAKNKIMVDGKQEHTHMPLWTIGGGPLRRQCTREYKLVPIKHCIRRIMGFDVSLPPHPKPGACSVWLGISWDEMERMKASKTQYMKNRWPLLEKRLTRTDCKDYLNSHNLPVPVKSSCVGCPYRDASTWIEIMHEDNGDYYEAVQYDKQIRNIALAGVSSNQLFVYRTSQPLDEVDFVKEAKKERKSKQLPLLCGGLCNV